MGAMRAGERYDVLVLHLTKDEPVVALLGDLRILIGVVHEEDAGETLDGCPCMQRPVGLEVTPQGALDERLKEARRDARDHQRVCALRRRRARHS